MRYGWEQDYQKNLEESDDLQNAMDNLGRTMKSLVSAYRNLPPGEESQALIDLKNQQVIQEANVVKRYIRDIDMVMDSIIRRASNG